MQSEAPEREGEHFKFLHPGPGIKLPLINCVEVEVREGGGAANLFFVIVFFVHETFLLMSPV